MVMMVSGYFPAQVLASEVRAGTQVQSLTGATLIGTDVNITASNNDTWPNRVGLVGRTGAPNLPNPPGVSPLRYFLTINGVTYEAFCVDPHLPGPENSNAPPYRILGTRNDLRTILRYGFPTNSAFLSNGDAYSAYVTRVAVALAGSEIAGFGGELVGDSVLIGWAHTLMGGGDPASFVCNSRVLVNGAANYSNEGFAEGGMVVSEPFQLSGVTGNPVRISAPAGVQILSGSAGNTAVNLNNPITSDMTFRIAVPEGSITPGETVSIDIRGVNYAYAGQVWSALTTSNPDNFQEMVFYIPRVAAQASMQWFPDEEDGRLRIVKRSQATNQGLGGAVFQITGPYGFSQTITTPANGVINLADLEFGEYTITEITPPAGYYLSEPVTQTVTVAPGSDTVATVTFINPRTTIPRPEPREAEPASVRIQKIDALSRENIPGALMRIEGRSSFQMVTGDGQIWEIDNRGIDMSIVLTAGHTLPVVPEQSVDEDGNPTGPPPVSFELEDGVLTIHNLPWGYYRVQEERAPDGYSLLPQHTAFSFWLLPPNVLVDIWDGGGVGAGNTNGAPEDGSIEAMIAAIFNDNFGGPAYDLPDDFPPGESEGGGVEFIIDEEANVNSILITFENYPFSEIVVYKHCNVTGVPLAGAHIRIQGFFVEGNAPVITDRTYVTDSAGRVVFYGLPAGTYTISEVQPPPGFMLDSPNFRSVDVSWGQTRANANRPAPVVRFYNTPMSSLEVIKIDGDTGARLDGAVFELRDPTTGETWQGTTVGGSVRLGQGANGNELIPDRTYILTELQPPAGYVLIPAPREVVLSPGDNNQVTVRNYQNPSLTIIKRDLDTGALLDGAVFEVSFENGQTLPGTFTSGDDGPGTVIIPWTLLEGNTERTLIITEVIPPPGFNLANPNWQRVTMRQGEHNQVIFENRRMPTLTIQKVDARTGYPVQGAWFEIEYLGATAGTGSGNIGPSGLLTGNPFITDANGRIVIEGVYSGRYRIREVRAANNYWLTPLEADRTWIIEVRDNEDYILVVENTLLPTLVITKRNALTWRPIPMTQFRVEFEIPNSPHVQHIGYFMTNMQGQIILPFVQVGWYRVTETRPAFGMTLATNNNFRIFLQPGDNSYSLIQQGIIASESMITPTVAPAPDTGDEPVFEPDEADEDREYLERNGEIENAPTPDIPDDAEVEVIEPDMDAIVDSDLAPEIGDLANNVYTNFPDGFFDGIDLENIEVILYDNPQLATRMSSNLQVWGGDHFWNNDLGVWNFPQNSLIIRKENAITGQLLQGATFSVTQISSGNDSGLAGTIIGYFTTNHSGIIVIAGLDPGYFLVEETIPPDNFTLSTNNRQHAFLRPDGTSIVEMTFSNLPYSSLIITLRCSVTSAPIPNGEFRITNSAGAVVGTDNGHFWTNLQGEILIPNVIPDSYVITQVTVPPQFVIQLVQSTQTIRVNPTGQIYRVDFFSDPLSNLLITLRCEVTGQPIQGGEFRVTNSAGNVVGNANGIFFTNLQGEITIPGLGVDSYVVTQLNAPTGFRLGDQNSQTIFIVRPAETYALNFTNEPYSGLIIQNLDGYNGDPLPGVRFRIEQISDTGNVLIGEHITDANGRIELTGLLGSFNITQLDVPNGWEFDAQPTRIAHVNTGTPTLVTFHSPRMGSLEITLADENGNPLSGGRFEVRRQNGQLVGEFVTPVSGMISLPNLGSGWFTVEQIAAPQGFVMTDTGRSVEVSANTVARANFVNIGQPSLVIEKVDTEGNPLAGAEFEVRTLSGALVHRGTTNNGGIITIAGLEPGAFTITETRAPQGFVITEPARTVTIAAGQNVVERFVNHRQPSLIIEKVDTDGNPLAGAEFEVRTLGGQLVHRAVTNQGGLITIPYLTPGSYQVIETRAPEGFVITEPARAIEIFAGQTVTERFINHRMPALIIEKVDTDGNPLAGATFEVRTLAGLLVERIVTNQGGMAIIHELAPGSYEIIETIAPQGFALVEGSRAIQIVAG